MGDSTFENKLVKLTFRADKILHLHYMTDRLDLKLSKEILSFTRSHCPWSVSPLLITGNEFMNQDKESLAFNGSDEVLQYCSAIAFIAESLSKRILANFYMSVNKGKIPMRFFSTTEEAIKWLSDYPSIPQSKREGLHLVK